ncbi:DUF551 domain-containing protein [Enterobacter cloacae]|uniref:DUF551 domain-containing protein n=1 Tax=Enterobacter cloacae TaxID=550 RepID=UPI00254E3EB9|nr:DUF551 domain-containing protein [Enterobacter cloacae]
MSTISKERAQEIFLGNGPEPTASEERELARIALALLEAEAVEWRVAFRLDEQPGSDFEKTFESQAKMNEVISLHERAGFSASITPLYTAPPAPVSVHDDIDTRMKNAGMLSAAEIIAGQPIDAFMKHAGVVDLESLLKWAEMRRAEFLRMQAKYELGDNQKDDMYEWVISHVAAFSELHINIRAAMLQGAEPVTTAYKLPDDFDFDRFNDVVWLEAVASNPHMHSLTTSTIAMVALELNKRLEAGNSPVIPDGLRLALSNAGIAAPESDEMLAATCEKYIQALVTWVKDRKPFRSAVIPDGWVACSERMPEVGVKVLCFPVNDEPIHATYNGQVWLQDISWSTSDEPIDNVISCNVFHWMPLPAAPQQE